MHLLICTNISDSNFGPCSFMTLCQLLWHKDALRGLLEFMPQWFRAVLSAQRGATRCEAAGLNVVAGWYIDQTYWFGLVN